MSNVVCNASPLIVLAKAKLLHVIPKIFEQAFVPQAVLDEVSAGPPDDPLREALPNCSWLVPVRIYPPLSPLSTWAIDRGEAEVIEYARLNGNLPVMIDDRRVRRVAERLGLKVHGTVGIVAAATSAENFTKAFRGHVLSLRTAGLYVSDDLIDVLEKRIGSGTA